METKEVQNKLLEIIKVFDSICRESNIWYTLASGSMLGAVRHAGFIPWDTDMDVFVKVSDVEALRNALLKGIPSEMKLYMWDLEKNYHACFDRISFRDIPHEKVSLDIFPLIGAPDTYNAQIKFVKKCFYSYKILRTKHVDTAYSTPSHVRKIKVLKVFTKIIPDAIIRKWYHYLHSRYDFEQASYVYTIASGYGMKECLPKDLMLNTEYKKFEDTKLPIPVRYDEYLTRVYGDYLTPKKEGYKENIITATQISTKGSN